jgi:hypothetical protein
MNISQKAAKSRNRKKNDKRLDKRGSDVTTGSVSSSNDNSNKEITEKPDRK